MSHNDLLRIQNLKVCAGEKEGGIFIGHPEEGLYTVEGPKVERKGKDIICKDFC